MRMSLVKILTWTSPVKSVLPVILLNLFLLRFLFHQRPICGASVVLLLCFLRKQWKQRKSEVLPDPLDSEEWVNITSHDLEKSLFDFAKTVLKTWVSLRRDHYLMWVVVTLVFWISLAKLATLVSFPTMLFVLSNGVFIAALLLKRYQFEFVRSQGEDDDSSEPKNNKVRNHLRVRSPHLKGLSVQPFKSISSCSLTTQITDSEWKKEAESWPVHPIQSEGSLTFTEPESPYGASIPSHEDSSEDEFLFDPKHFDSNSSSTSNSFEHLHF